MNKEIIITTIALIAFWVAILYVSYNALLWGINLGAQAGGSVL